MDMPDYWLSHPFNGPGAVANGWTSIKNALKSLYFQLELNTLGVLSVLIDKNLND
jgi:hypothetical protein